MQKQANRTKRSRVNGQRPHIGPKLGLNGPNFGYLGPILAQNEVFDHLLDIGSFDLPDFAYYDSLQ